ncbi:MAG: hypothetical protein OEY63_01945 [Gemmatimonadota bacterium]|nr:hypothetical protein [Gemmatimonadota bacterium]
MQPIIPLSLYQAIQASDRPTYGDMPDAVDDRVIKLGRTTVVANQIARFERMVREGRPVVKDELTQLYRITARRTDAALVFAEAGRLVGRKIAGKRAGWVRFMQKLLPSRWGQAYGESTARKLARKNLGLDVPEQGYSAVVKRPYWFDAGCSPDVCGMYGSALAELLRLFTTFDGAMFHVMCAGKGGDRCEWRVTTDDGGVSK